ncbi:HD domain-containing protein [Sorangium sp. So ce726]|uniref:HD domain-containing protein n=1 Tax=Sorangium sp. So ce726 TaxID=3133319 RepID=UPI003F5FDAD5
MKDWEALFAKKLEETDLGNDPAHDLAHFTRVVATARSLAADEGARLEIVVPAAWLHDLVNVPKNDPRRSQASRLSAEEALRFLRSVEYPGAFLPDIAHAIESHSYSAGIEPTTLEARVVQDADRLDGLGAIGIARCFAVGGLLGVRFYDPGDPFAERRPWDDRVNAIDHFHVKLFKTAESLKTAAGRREGARRAEFMRQYLARLALEIGGEMASDVS